MFNIQCYIFSLDETPILLSDRKTVEHQGSVFSYFVLNHKKVSLIRTQQTKQHLPATV